MLQGEGWKKFFYCKRHEKARAFTTFFVTLNIHTTTTTNTPNSPSPTPLLPLPVIYHAHTKYPNTFFHSPFVGLSIKQKPQNCIYATHLMINDQIFQFAMKSEILCCKSLNSKMALPINSKRCTVLYKPFFQYLKKQTKVILWLLKSGSPIL